MDYWLLRNCSKRVDVNGCNMQLILTNGFLQFLGMVQAKDGHVAKGPGPQPRK